MKRLWKDPAYRARHEQINKEIASDPVVIRQKGEAMQAHYADPAYRAAHPVSDMQHINSDPAQAEARSLRLIQAHKDGKYKGAHLERNFEGRIRNATTDTIAMLHAQRRES